MTSITIYDGADSIGGNKINAEENGSSIFLDFGTNFGKTSQFLSDFLKNRKMHLPPGCISLTNPKHIIQSFKFSTININDH